MIELHIRIKKIRESKGITQEYVANELGVHQSGYSKIENGQRELSAKELIKLSEIYEMSINEIISPEDKNQNNFMLNEPNEAYGVKTDYDLSITISIKDWKKSKEILQLIGVKN